MVRRMKELIQTVYKDRLEKQGIDIARQQAELLALYSQINPHFLYNTLDAIVWLAEENRKDEVVSMVTALSDFFRTTLSKGRDFITVREERSHNRKLSEDPTVQISGYYEL